MTDQQTGPSDHVDPEGYEARARSAFASLDGVREALDRQLAKLDGMSADAADPKALVGLQADVARALGRAVETEGKAHDARVRQERGGGIDLGAAAAEVRRRLARLRAAGDGGAADGGAE